MYNRYIPQPDGSYQRKRVEQRKPPAPPPPARPQQPPCPPPEKPCPPPERPCEPQPSPPKEPPCRRASTPEGFLRNLLPKDFDTGDLIVILLLLLLAGDCEENRSNALLTLVLYLFM